MPRPPDFRLDLVRAASFADIRAKLPEVLDRHADALPRHGNAKILLKPNFNANMNALTGNTTDLRLLSALILCLRDRGHTDITIGEGTNSGFYRNRIGVISRLRVDALAAKLGVRVIDLNFAEGAPVAFENGQTAQVAKPCLEADCLINLPKLKTHFEAGMSVCAKNLMGCLVGQDNKKKTHQSLAANILRLSDALRPDLHIVDALVPMEGLGPTRGTPLRMDLLAVGRDPLFIDLACAALARFDYRAVRTLALAEAQGRLTPAHHAALAAMDLAPHARSFAPPKAGWIASFIHSPKRQKYFLAVRQTRLFTYLAGTDWFGGLLFATGLRQDVFSRDEARLDRLVLDTALCDGCGACRTLCPLGLDPVVALPANDPDCVGCLYCFLGCPRTAIAFEGELGFLAEQMRQYDSLTRRLYAGPGQ